MSNNDIELSPLFYFDKTLKPRPEHKPLTIVEPEVKTELDQVLDKQKSQDLNTVWFEKYRPVTFDEIIGQKKIVNSIKRNLNNLPHLILEGKAGIGKTTLVRVLTNELQATLLELNSSDERGIDIIRGKVSNFIKHASMNKSLKIVFFDEADSMTSEAQMSLRAIIEKHSTKTRFIFACNNIKKIIEPLKSRCKTFHFDNIDLVDMYKRLKEIINSENITITDQELNEIVNNSEGDFRKAINDLQMI